MDVQRDFLPEGSLAVPQGDEVVSIINSLRARATFPCGVFLSKDWHPPTHVSFCNNHGAEPFSEKTLVSGHRQTLWPPHCVQGTRGAEFAGGLVVEMGDKVILKGTHEEHDSYSAFFDNLKKHQTELHQCLTVEGVDTLYVCGLALDVCVLFTVLDAVALGYNTVLLEDASVRSLIRYYYDQCTLFSTC